MFELKTDNLSDELKPSDTRQTLRNTILGDFPQLRTKHRPFGKFRRKLIFALIFFLNVCINIDHGAIPAATTILKRDLNIDNISLGIIGSLVYLGLVLGAISAGPIFRMYSSKWIVILSIITSCIFLYFFTIAENVAFLAICRIGCGFFQVYCYIYFPVWVDQFGVHVNRTLWITFLQLGVPLGTMIGYVMEAYFIRSSDDWRGCFYTQILFQLFGVVLFVLTPDKFFSKHYKRSNTPRHKVDNEFEAVKSQLLSSRKYSKDKITIIDNLYERKYGRPSRFSVFSLIDENDEFENQSYFSIVCDLLRNKVYIFTMLGICCLLFIITGIQFWISDYMQTVLHAEPRRVFITFSLVCITAPILGVMLGGYLISNLGGYTNKRALNACFQISILAAASGVFLPLIDNFYFFVFLMWLLLFFGGSIVPGLTGIMISSAAENVKEISNSITHLCYNLLGYLPSPFLYGLICKYTGGATSRYGLAFILLWSFFGVFFLYLAKNARESIQDKPIKRTESTAADTNHYDYDGHINEENTNAMAALYGRMSLT